MDMLVKRLGMDPLEFRLQNAIKPGDTSPTQAPLNSSNLGDLTQCIVRLKQLIQWEEGDRIVVDRYKVRAKGLACVWKTSGSAIDAGSGATITVNSDGTLNLSVGAVEIGQGNRTIMAQILAERMHVPIRSIHIKMDVDTQITPEHWKTVMKPSSSTMMVGRAVLCDAAADIIAQLKHNASLVFIKWPVERLEVGNGTVYVQDEPNISLEISEIASGYMYPDGSAIGEPVIGRGQ